MENQAIDVPPQKKNTSIHLLDELGTQLDRSFDDNEDID